MSDITVRTPDDVRKERAAVEAEIAACQETIDSFAVWRQQIGGDFWPKARAALAAVKRKDKLLLRIEHDALWAFDYDSAVAYYESKGFSRQRWSQIKYATVWKQLVKGFDEFLPAPSGNRSRYFGSTDPKVALPAWKRAVRESDGQLPSESKTKELLAAAKEGVKMDDDSAILRWRDRKHLQEIEHHYNALVTDEAKEEARGIVQ